MQEKYPHEIIDVATGKPAPKGYVPITEKEREILNGRTPEERAEWIKARRAESDERFARAKRKR